LHKLIAVSKAFLGKQLVKKQSTKKQKEILFVIESLSLGGAEKSLTVLLNNLDVNQYQLTVLLFVKHGIFLKNIPASVNVMYHPNLRLRLRERILFKVSKIINLERFHAAQWFWSLFGVSYYDVPKTFDIAIAYSQGFVTYYCATKVQANKKIAWVNTDYHKAGYYANIDLTYYQRFDDIVAVSDVALESFRKSFNQADLKAQRLHAIQDILDVELIRLMSNDPTSFNYQSNKFKLITVCRLSKEKGLDMAVDACVELKKNGLHFQWLVVGEGPMLNQLQDQIIKHEIQNELILLGAVPNPYPFMKQADVYVQTSYFEGFGIALHEAAALKLPLVATDIPAANALVRHELNGLICASNAISIAQSIMRLYQSPDLHKKMHIELENYQSNKKQSLHLINQLFND
jgi:glycosyltransferase involved in cell wall biosynthesis